MIFAHKNKFTLQNLLHDIIILSDIPNQTYFTTVLYLHALSEKKKKSSLAWTLSQTKPNQQLYKRCKAFGK